jgi:hypothetical protein
MNIEFGIGETVAISYEELAQHTIFEVCIVDLIGYLIRRLRPEIECFLLSDLKGAKGMSYLEFMSNIGLVDKYFYRDVKSFIDLLRTTYVYDGTLNFKMNSFYGRIYNSITHFFTNHKELAVLELSKVQRRIVRLAKGWEAV